MIERLIKILVALVLFLFIGWIIYDANMENDNLILDGIRSVPYGDKAGHFFLYGGLTLFLNLAFNYKFLARKFIQLGMIVVLLFAIGEEFTQIWLDTRTFDFVDILFDLLGVFTFNWLSLKLKK